VPNFLSHFDSASSLESKPLKGLRVGLIRETIEDGVDAGVVSAIRAAASHFEELGCSVNEVLQFIFLYDSNLNDISKVSLHAYIIKIYSSVSPFHLSINLQVSLPSFSLGLPAYYVLALSESSSNLSRYDGIRSVADILCTPLSLRPNTHN
jgi:aspartyl-tRNA(Asn)/glutamyl-tRNA(Gln) amidotransferase subunit A